PVHLANLFYRTLSFYACTVSNFEQFTLAEFINEGYFEKHINRMRLYYIRKREKLMEAIGKSRLHSLCEIIENDSGLHFLLQLHTNQSDHDVQMALEAKGIHVAALSEYYFVQSDKEHYFIMNYSNFKLEEASQVFDEIASVI
ncbi:MAG TPA: PLP-dependent aminotransferase family protein, partial [Lachnospiraceae bacterium]|nr:PLP-dependent aminotransferase family protein [Lachnospiraceae bacterium]